MKKHLFAISTYFATFFISFFLVSLLTERPQTKATSCFPNRNTTKVFTASEISEEDHIKNLLKSDYNYGTDYFAYAQNAEETEKLVEKMRGLDNSHLPMPIRKSYQEHIGAWDNYAKHLSKNHDSTDSECKILNRKINETYSMLLFTAKDYDVDFHP